MKKILLTFGLSSFFFVGATCEAPEPFKRIDANKASMYKKLALFDKGETEDGKISDLPILVNLWATWCPPCRKELPFLQQLATQKQVNVQLVNIEDNKADAEKTLQTLGITKLKTRYVQMELLDDLNVYGLPASIVYDHDSIYMGVGVLNDEVRINEWFNCLNEK